MEGYQSNSRAFLSPTSSHDSFLSSNLRNLPGGFWLHILSWYIHHAIDPARCGGWLTSLIHQIRKDFHSWTGFCSKSIHPSNDCIDLVILVLNFICIKLRPLMHLLIVFRYILKCRSRQVMEDVNSSMNRFSIKEGIVNCRTCPIIYLLVLLSTKLEDSWSRDNVIHSITGDFHIRVKGNVDAMSWTIQITQKVTK